MQNFTGYMIESLVLMVKTCVCPQCNGSQRVHRFGMDIPREICTGSGVVPEWDYERLCKLVGKPTDCEQMSMNLEGAEK